MECKLSWCLILGAIFFSALCLQLWNTTKMGLGIDRFTVNRYYPKTSQAFWNRCPPGAILVDATGSVAPNGTLCKQSNGIICTIDNDSWLSYPICPHTTTGQVVQGGGFSLPTTVESFTHAGQGILPLDVTGVGLPETLLRLVPPIPPTETLP